MELDKVVAIVDRLIEKIDANASLEWSQVDNFRYGVKLGKIWVCFRKYDPEDPYEEETMYVEFLSSAGEVIESFTDTELKPIQPYAFAFMKRLWKIGRMRSSGFDQILDDVLGDLE
jgi:hypothetical protein